MNAKFLFEPLKTYFISHFALAFVTRPFIPSILPKQTSSNLLPSFPLLCENIAEYHVIQNTLKLPCLPLSVCSALVLFYWLFLLPWLRNLCFSGPVGYFLLTHHSVHDMCICLYSTAIKILDMSCVLLYATTVD